MGNESRVIAIFAAHPDDEVLGVGGTHARLLAEGHLVHERIVGKGRGDILDQQFDTRPFLEYVQLIEGWINELQPHTVYSHWRGDLNRDHQIIAEAVEVATRPLPGCPVKEVYAFEIQGDRRFVPDIWVPLSAKDVGRKIHRMWTEYSDEMRDYPHSRSSGAITAHSQYRGMQCGHFYAEAFIMVRRVL